MNIIKLLHIVIMMLCSTLVNAQTTPAFCTKKNLFDAKDRNTLGLSYAPKAETVTVFCSSDSSDDGLSILHEGCSHTTSSGRFILLSPCFLWLLTHNHVKHHHQHEPYGKAYGAHVAVLTFRGFRYQFLHYYVEHRSSGKGKHIG